MSAANYHELQKHLEGVNPYDQAYFLGLYEQLQDPKREQVALGKNCLPTSFISKEERAQIAHEVDGAAIEANERYAQIARSTVVDNYDLNAGLGSSLGMQRYYANLLRQLGLPEDTPLGTKGSSLGYPGPDGRIYTGAQIKANRILKEAGRLGQINICTVVNEDSDPVMRAVYEGRAALGDIDKTYTQLFDEAGNIGFGEWLHQGKIPTLDANKKITREHMAPGSHGHAGVMLMQHIRHTKPRTEYDVSIMYNGDGASNFVTPNQIGYTAAEAAMVLYSKRKSKRDKKGGFTTVYQLPSGIWVPGIMELAQAKEADQEEFFYDTGIRDNNVPQELAANHHLGEQGFNTNNASFNNNFLHKFFNAIVKKRGEAYFNRFAAPELMLNKKVDGKTGEMYYQMEGALASLMFNMNAKVQEDVELQELWNEISGGKPFLKIVYMEEDLSQKCFSPIKYGIDHHMYTATDLYSLDIDNWHMTEHFPGEGPRFEGDFVKSGKYFSDVQNVHDALGNAKMRHLDEFSVTGAFHAPDAEWKGMVEIDAGGHPQPLDLTDPALATHLGLFQDGQFVFENIKIIRDKQGNIRQEALN